MVAVFTQKLLANNTGHLAGAGQWPFSATRRKIPQEENDVKVDQILLEQETIACPDSYRKKSRCNYERTRDEHHYRITTRKKPKSGLMRWSQYWKTKAERARFLAWR